MKRIIFLFILLLCCLLPACQNGSGSRSEPSSMASQLSADEQEPSYVKAYTDFLLTVDFVDSVESEYANFPVRSFILLDLNFDRIPELLVFHDSCGSMGGYFRYYYFDGTGIKDVSGSSSAYTKIIADKANKKVYLLKEMYLLKGNENGTSGYLSEIVSENGVPCFVNILRLEVDPKINLEKYYGKNYHKEDDFLLDDDLEACLIKEYYNGRETLAITSREYLQKKRELLWQENEYVDLLDTNAQFYWSREEVLEAMEDDAISRSKKLTKEEIDQLFFAWFDSLE